jgi:hypothetical protein
MEDCNTSTILFEEALFLLMQKNIFLKLFFLCLLCGYSFEGVKNIKIINTQTGNQRETLLT